jgi:hypothetical protein
VQAGITRSQLRSYYFFLNQVGRKSLMIQRVLIQRNVELPIGSNLEDVDEEEGWLYGDVFKIAARLENLAQSDAFVYIVSFNQLTYLEVTDE